MLEAIEKFRGFMLDNLGEAPKEIIPDGSVKRFKINGKSNGWYNLHIDGRAAGSCGDWKENSKFTWKNTGVYPPLTDQQRIDFKIEHHRQQLIRKTEQDKIHNDTAIKAASIWNKSDTPISHAYLAKKRVKPHCLGIYKGSLVVPIFNHGALVSVQFIDPEGNKRFLSGSKLKGSYSQLGEYGPDKTILVCEGWATGASLFESTGNLIFVAFSAGNLKGVAQYVRSLYSTNQIILMGDNDISGVGQKAARDAALAIGGKYLIPDTDGNDWNDVVNRELML